MTVWALFPAGVAGGGGGGKVMMRGQFLLWRTGFEQSKSMGWNLMSSPSKYRRKDVLIYTARGEALRIAWSMRPCIATQ